MRVERACVNDRVSSQNSAALLLVGHAKARTRSARLMSHVEIVKPRATTTFASVG